LLDNRGGHDGAVRVAIFTESFLPEVNGVTNSVLRVVEHLEQTGHEALVLAPGSGPDRYRHAPVVRVRSVPVPRYPSLSLGLPSPRVEGTIRLFGPDVVHLASPFALGAHGAAVASKRGIPAVAVYQTDVAAFLSRYGLRGARRPIWGWLRRIHARAALNLAPSSAAAADLDANGIGNVVVWARGVDGEVFNPAHRDGELRGQLAPNGELLVGYVGRLAFEKRVELLSAIGDLPGVRVVVVGDGPARAALSSRLPGATFLGFRGGRELSRIYASLDVFVHTGPDETFCQSVQEALSSGVPALVPASGGPLDLVRHGDNGLLWAPGEPASLRAAVMAVVEDPALRAALARRARPSVAGRTWEAVGDQLLGHYRAVMAAAGKGEVA
jgi:phosphatidylinositol alpha 1,6-mannosyltransferase